MGHREYEIRKLRDLKKGDIVYLRIPYEENTRDYYNGYNPKEIRGHMFKDRFGDTSKPRMVIVVGRDGNNMLYLPLTSRHSGFDSDRHYVLQDNSMTWKKDPDMKSYVEISSLRAVYIDPERDLHYDGRIRENDMVNIMVKLGRREINLESRRDQRAYVSRNKDEAFERHLMENGYMLSKERSDGRVFSGKEGRTVKKSKWGLVHYHVPLSKEEVKRMVEKREEKPEDEFARAVYDITEKFAVEERGVIG